MKTTAIRWVMLGVVVFSEAQAARLIVKYREGSPARRALRLQSGAPFTVVTVQQVEHSREEYKKDPAVEYVEEDVRVAIQEVGIAPQAPQVPEALRVASRAQIAEQKSYGNNWGLEKIRAAQAWRISPGRSGVLVAIVDTGVDRSHPDLNGAVESGYDFVDQDDDPSDGHGHGTHVAGIVGGRSTGDRGVWGVAPGSRLLPVRVLDGDGVGYVSTVAEGIRYAAVRGAKIINISLGTVSTSRTLEEAVIYALQRGCVVVAAAGNAGQGKLMFPAAYPGVLAVAAVDDHGERAQFTNYSDAAVCAPGVKIYSSFAKGGYDRRSGTSMAAPHVSGVAVLLWEALPELTAREVAERIRATADDLGPRGIDPWYGFGQVNAYRALATTRSAAATLEGMRIFPNPVSFSQAVRGTLKFDRLSRGSRLKVFAVSGELVRVLALGQGDASVAADQLEWDGKNEKGELVSMGTYFFVMEDAAGARKTGKIGVLP